MMMPMCCKGWFTIITYLWAQRINGHICIGDYRQRFVNSDSLQLTVIEGDALWIETIKDKYINCINDCKWNLHGRLVLNKIKHWQIVEPWKIIPFCLGFHELSFGTFKDMSLASPIATINIKSRVLHLS